MRALGNALIWVGIAGIVVGLGWGSGHLRRAASLHGMISELDVKIDTTRASLFAANARYRGYTASLKTIPDSIKHSQSFILMRKGDDYRKRVVALERNEDEFMRQRRRRRRQSEEEKANILSHTLPLAGGGLVLVAIGVVVRRNSFAR